VRACEEKGEGDEEEEKKKNTEREKRTKWAKFLLHFVLREKKALEDEKEE
jgi:hypothetical protein